MSHCFHPMRHSAGRFHLHWCVKLVYHFKEGRRDECNLLNLPRRRQCSKFLSHRHRAQMYLTMTWSEFIIIIYHITFETDPGYLATPSNADYFHQTSLPDRRMLGGTNLLYAEMPPPRQSHCDSTCPSTVGLVPRVESLSLLLNALLFPAATSRRKASGRPFGGTGGGVDVPTNPESRPR